MLRNRKAIVLTAVTLLAAGCANSDRLSRQGNRMWQPVSTDRWRATPDTSSARVTEAQPPQILPETHFAAARLFESEGLCGKAIVQYRKAIAVNHYYVEAYHRLGLLLSMTGRREEALIALRRAVNLKPNSAILRNNLGFDLLLNQRWEEARRELIRAIELKPGFSRAYVNLGIIQSKLGRFDDALASFQAVLPKADAYYNLGLMYRGQQRYEEAVQAFRQVLSLNPDFAAARTQMEQIGGHFEPVPTPEPETRVARMTPATESVKAAIDAEEETYKEPVTEEQFDRTAEAKPIETLASTAEATEAPPTATKPAADEMSWDQVLASLDEAFSARETSRQSQPVTSRRIEQASRTRDSSMLEYPEATFLIDRATSEVTLLNPAYDQINLDALIAFAEHEFDCPYERRFGGTDFSPLARINEPRENLTTMASTVIDTQDAASEKEATPASDDTVTLENARITSFTGEPPSTSEPQKADEDPRENVLLIDADAPVILGWDDTLADAATVKATGVYKANENAADDSQGDRFTTEAFTNASVYILEWSVADEPVSYTSIEETFSPFDPIDPTELNMTVWEPPIEQTGTPVSSIDTWATLRELEARLQIVRNEITCLDLLDVIAVERRALARSMGFPSFVNVPPFAPFEGKMHMGPPEKLAQAQEMIKKEASKARLVSDVAHKKTAKKAKRTKRARKPKTDFDTGNTADKPKPKKTDKPEKRRTPTARSTDWTKTFDRLSGLREIVLNEINCYNAAETQMADLFAPVETADAHWPVTPCLLGVFDTEANPLTEWSPVIPVCWTNDPVTPPENAEDTAESKADQYHNIHGIYGHQLEPLRD